MIKSLYKVNRWFDDQKEPDRFIVFFFFILIPIVLIQLYDTRLFVIVVAILMAIRVWWLYLGGSKTKC